MCGIYKITNLINKKAYIGQSTNIHKRMTQHKNRYVKENCSEYNNELYKEMREFGINNFDFEIIEECPKDELNLKEIYWIKYYNAYEYGYNKNEGGNSGNHVKLTNEDLDEIRRLLKETELTNTEIGELFNVTDDVISRINTGLHWKRDDIKYPIRNRQRREDHCLVCGKVICKGSTYCKDHVQIPTKRPPKEELIEKIKEMNGNFLRVGKFYGVSDNSVRKWCQFYSLPFHSSDYKTKQ